MTGSRSSTPPPRGGRRLAHKAETRRVVLDAAYALLEENGFEATTMRAVAARAGVALGTIFLHFPDKAALVVAAFETDVAHEIDTAFATLPRSSVERQLLHVGRTLYAFYLRRPRLARVLVPLAMSAEGEAGARLLAQVQDFLARVAALIEAGASRGELRRDVPARDAALCFWADYLVGLAAGLAPGAASGASEQVLATLLRLRMEGLSPSPPRTRRRRR